MAERGVVLSLDEGTTGATAVVVGLDGEVAQRVTARSPSTTRSPPGLSTTRWRSGPPSRPRRKMLWARLQRRPLTFARLASPTSARRWPSGTEALSKPLAPAIVWQDRRTASVCDRLTRGRPRGTAFARSRGWWCSIPTSPPPSWPG